MKKYQEKPAETDTLFQVLNEEKEALAGVDIDLQTCEERSCKKREAISFANSFFAFIKDCEGCTWSTLL